MSRNNNNKKAPHIESSTFQHRTTSPCWEEEGCDAVSEQNGLFSYCMHFRLCLRHSKTVCKAVWNPLVFVSSCRSQQVAVIMKSLNGRVNSKNHQTPGSKVPSNRASSTELQAAPDFESSSIDVVQAKVRATSCPLPLTSLSFARRQKWKFLAQEG